MLDQPQPQATSATRAGGSASSRSWTAGTAGSHLLPSRCVNIGRVKASCPSTRSAPYVLEGNTGAGPVRLEQLLHRLAGADDEPSERPHEVEAQLVEQRLVVAGGEAEASFLRVRLGVVDLEDAGRGLLLEPLARIALVNAGGVREAARRERPRVGQRTVEAQPVAEIDPVEVHRAEGRLEEATHERVSVVLLRRRSRAVLRHPCGDVRGCGRRCGRVELRELGERLWIRRLTRADVDALERLGDRPHVLGEGLEVRLDLVRSGGGELVERRLDLVDVRGSRDRLREVCVPICANSSQFSADAKSSPLVSVVSVVSVSVVSRLRRLGGLGLLGRGRLGRLGRRGVSTCAVVIASAAREREYERREACYDEQRVRTFLPFQPLLGLTSFDPTARPKSAQAEPRSRRAACAGTCPPDARGRANSPNPRPAA